MNANDIRIGNWLSLGKFDVPTKVFTIGFNRIDRFLVNDVPVSEYNPIPLTIEIIETAGFEYVHGQIEFYKNANVYLYWDGEELSANFGHIEQLDVSVKYVHELQNLFFVLTKTELPINL